MATRFTYHQTHDIVAWRDLGPDFLDDNFRRLARLSAAADGVPPPPEDVPIERVFERWSDAPEQELATCAEADADVVVLTARWEA